MAIHQLNTYDDLFAGLPNVMFCRKKATGEYLAANAAFIQRVGRRREADIVGRTVHDLFAEDLAASYEAQDRALLNTGRSVHGQLEIISDGQGNQRWFLTNKVLETTDHGQTILVVSVEAALHHRGVGSDPGSGLRAVLEYAGRTFAESPRIEDLAEAGGFSPTQLERRMRRVLGLSPKQYLQRVRIEHGAMLLATSDLSIADIAVRCGFYDQSQFTRMFHTAIGLTPAVYRAG